MASGRLWPRRSSWKRAISAAFRRWATLPRPAAVCRGRTSARGSGKARATSNMATRLASGPLWRRPNVPSASVRRGSAFPNVKRPKALGCGRGRRWPIHSRERAMTAYETWCPWRSRKPLAEVRPAVGVGWEAGRKNGAQPCRLLRPDLNPGQMARHRMVESGAASAVSPMESNALHCRTKFG
jgi:hypothetical protein